MTNEFAATMTPGLTATMTPGLTGLTATMTPGLASLTATMTKPDRSDAAMLIMPRSPAVRPVAIISVMAHPLDGILRGLGVSPSDVELLVPDTQGSEHKALAGAPAVLAHVKAVVVEMPEALRYVGQASAAAIESILSRNGLTRRRGGRLWPGLRRLPAGGVLGATHRGAETQQVSHLAAQKTLLIARDVH